jgi:hypothetical protein
MGLALIELTHVVGVCPVQGSAESVGLASNEFPNVVVAFCGPMRSKPADKQRAGKIKLVSSWSGQ